MKKYLIISLLAGSAALAAGCENGAIPFEIRYEKPSAPSADEGTRTEGETGDVIVPSGPSVGDTAGDEVITPEEYAGTPVPEAPAPEPASPEVPETTDVEGADDSDEPHLIEPPLPPPVSCDEPAFAFVSNRSGRDQVHSQSRTGTATLSGNRWGHQHYRRLTMMPGTEFFAVDQGPGDFRLIELGHLRSSSQTAMTTDDVVLTHGLAWNRDGGKSAYVAAYAEDGELIHEIRVLGTGMELVKVFKTPTNDLTVIRLAWWNNHLVFSGLSASGVSQLYAINLDRTPYRAEKIEQHVGSSGGFPNYDPLSGKDPSVSRNGNKLAYVKSGGALVVCDLAVGSGFLGTPRFKCREERVLTRLGHSEAPAFSPDGRWIYFSSERDGNKEIYRIHPDGTGEERLTNNPADDTYPAPFSPYSSCE